MDYYCLICGCQNPDKHHIKTVKSGGLNDPWNLVYLCRRHHIEIHSIGRLSFLKKYYAFRNYVELNGWVVTTTKMYHPKE